MHCINLYGIPFIICTVIGVKYRIKSHEYIEFIDMLDEVNDSLVIIIVIFMINITIFSLKSAVDPDNKPDFSRVSCY